MKNAAQKCKNIGLLALMIGALGVIWSQSEIIGLEKSSSAWFDQDHHKIDTSTIIVAEAEGSSIDPYSKEKIETSKFSHIDRLQLLIKNYVHSDIYLILLNTKTPSFCRINPARAPPLNISAT